MTDEGQKAVEAAGRFHKWAMPEPMSGCWLWIGCQLKSGYGVFRLYGKNTRAHRASWTLFKGDIPPNAWVLHRCDTPACVNPDHLFLGSHSDNMADMHRKKRGDMRGLGIEKKKAQTHCKRGHPLEGQNLYLRRDHRGAMRICRTCRAAWARNKRKPPPGLED